MLQLTRIDDSVDEDVPRDESVVVLVHLAEQVGEAGLLVVHELQELKRGKKAENFQCTAVEQLCKQRKMMTNEF